MTPELRALRAWAEKQAQAAEIIAVDPPSERARITQWGRAKAFREVIARIDLKPRK